MSTYTFLVSLFILRRRVSPMLLSCFSHSNNFHLLFNMVALYSFTPVCVKSATTNTNYPQAIHDKLGHERFLALYIASGMFGSWTSRIFSKVVPQIT